MLATAAVKLLHSHNNVAMYTYVAYMVCFIASYIFKIWVRVIGTHSYYMANHAKSLRIDVANLICKKLFRYTCLQIRSVPHI